MDIERLLYDPIYGRALDSLLVTKAKKGLTNDVFTIRSVNHETSKWCLVTINPKPDVDIPSFINKVHKMSTWTWITDMFYVFEQRGEDVVKGVHCHIVLYRGHKAPVHVKTQIQKSFEKMIGGPRSIDYKDLKTESDVKRAITYIKGVKDSSKMNKVVLDKYMRSTYKLEDIYIIGNRLDLLDSQ